MGLRALAAAFVFLGANTAFAQEPSLIGGTVADPKDWPASPWVGNCSSTLIGERVLLTAAHCVSNGGTKTFTIGTTRYSSTCTHHPDYRSNSTADWALCLVTTPVVGVPFELMAKPSDVSCAKGLEVTWTGYGCTRWGGQLDGRFRYGKIPVKSCPSGNNHDTVTTGAIALCSGDSGGGGFLVKEDGTRLVIGANSRSNTTDTSYVSSTYVAKFYNWALGWKTAKSVKICGYDADAASCRQAGGGQEPDPKPDDECMKYLAATEKAFTDLKACLSQFD